MSSILKGGPAFPVPMGSGREGMNLEDYFAAAALQGLLAYHGYDVDEGRYRDKFEANAVWAYKFAKAMVKARSSYD